MQQTFATIAPYKIEEYEVAVRSIATTCGPEGQLGDLMLQVVSIRAAPERRVRVRDGYGYCRQDDGRRHGRTCFRRCRGR